jgi:dihydrofolate synthase/folylpolyglutamate synthase
MSVITSVSLDHTRILGNTVEEIARKKAGIFKYNVPALIGPEVPLAVAQVLADQSYRHL